MNKIFSDTFLSNYLADFHLSSIAGVRGKVAVINSLISELKSKKLPLLKEEEIKSRFINSFFGDVLGFNYGNPGKWLLREEKKTVVDGTKPDAALGFFSTDDIDGDVRAVIEMKDFNANLDEKQKSRDNKSPVDQAFEYSPKMGGKCKWVIVSNMNEIRFYPSLDRSRCQVFMLENLSSEEELKALLFFFHKDRFIKEEGLSTTDKLFDKVKQLARDIGQHVHILDRMYTVLKDFEGLVYVDPNYIANLKPFNVLPESVWHFKNGLMVTLNAEIYHLLTNVSLIGKEIVITDDLAAEFDKATTLGAKEKLGYCFEFLRNCGITKIRALKDYESIVNRNKNAIGFSILHYMGGDDEADGVTMDIETRDFGPVCDCVKCNYRNFEFGKLISKVKLGVGNDDFDTLEYAFANYLLATDNFKTCYLIYKKMEQKLKGKEGKAVEYFLVKKNIKNLARDILYYHSPDDLITRNDVKTIDLDKVVYDEVEFEVSRAVKDYLIQIKEDVLIYDAQDQIDDSFYQIERLKRYYDGQEKRPNMFSGISELLDGYRRLYFHLHINCIVFINYGRYKYLCEKVFNGLILSLVTPKEGIGELDEFFITEAVLNIPSGNLKEVLGRIDSIKTSKKTQEKVIDKLFNFLTSYYSEGIFDHLHVRPEITEQLTNYAFESKYKQFFSNFFSILSRMDVQESEVGKIKRPLSHFLATEDRLFKLDLNELGRFLSKKGDLFAPSELVDMLRIFIQRDLPNINKYHDIIPMVLSAIRQFHPEYKINNQLLVETALLKCRSTNDTRADYERLLNLGRVCDDDCKSILFGAFEKYLDKNFNADFYEKLLERTDYPIARKDYFKKYVLYVNENKDHHTYRFGKHEFTDVIFIRFIFLICQRGVSRKKRELELLVNINQFERWVLAPRNFDYSKFEISWVFDIQHTIIMQSLKRVSAIRKIIKKELNRKYDIRLAEIYSLLVQPNKKGFKEVDAVE